MSQAAVSSGSPRLKFVSDVDDAFDRLVKRGVGLLRDGGSGAIPDMVENSKALNAVLASLDKLTSHDVAAAQGTAGAARTAASSTARRPDWRAAISTPCMRRGPSTPGADRSPAESPFPGA